MVDAKPRPIPDFPKLALIFDVFAKEAPSMVIERVWGRPTDGCSQAFAFGRSYGGILAMAAAHFMPIAEFTPVTWRKAMGLTKEDGKDGSRALATKLFPAYAHLWPLTKHHDRAEAVLIARYGQTLAERKAA